MTIRKIKYLVLLTLLMAVPSTWAETIDCTAITALPAIITTQGIYCLTGNLATNMTSGNAIDIQTNNVTIDLNGWKLGGLGAGAGTSTRGIYAFQRKNITIRNGTVRGFNMGIYLSDNSPYTTSQGHLIEDIRADKNTFTGINVGGRGSIARRNQVVDTGGSTVAASAYGIILKGPGVRLLNNDFSGTVINDSGVYALFIDAANGAVVEGNRVDDVSSDTSDAYGVYINSSDNVVVEDNRINGLSSNTGTTYGLFLNGSNDVLVAGNRFTSADVGINYIASSGKYMDNLTSNVTLPFVNGTPVGIND